jgi:hypothetical protein
VPVGLTLFVPLVVSVPVHPPLAVQDVALVLDQVNVELAPDAIVVGLAESVAVGAAAAVMVTVAVALLVLSATEVAVKVTVFGEGAIAGAEYVTDVAVTCDSVPHVEPLQPAPARLQVTPLLWESLVSVAVKFCVPVPACRLAEAGRIVTKMGGGGAIEPPDPHPVRVNPAAASSPAYNFKRCLVLDSAKYMCVVLPDRGHSSWGLHVQPKAPMNVAWRPDAVYDHELISAIPRSTRRTT